MYRLFSTCIPPQLMEALSQLDVTAPDHVSVITRDGKVTISVLKDGTSVTLGFPIKQPWTETTPRPPLQQSRGRMNGPIMSKEQSLAYLQELADRDKAQTTRVTVKKEEAPSTTTGKPQVHALKTVTYASQAELKRARELGNRFKSKLTESQVIELKQILADDELMSKFSSKTNAYKQLGQMYGVSHCRIQQIANGNGWNHIKV